MQTCCVIVDSTRKTIQIVTDSDCFDLPDIWDIDRLRSHGSRATKILSHTRGSQIFCISGASGPSYLRLGNALRVDRFTKRTNDHSIPPSGVARARAELDQLSLERTQLSEALRTSEEFKSRLIACSRDCIKVLDLEGRLLFMNQGGMQVLEICDVTPFLNGCWTEFWEGSDRDKAIAAVETARQGGVGRFTGYFETRIHRESRWWDVV